MRVDVLCLFIVAACAEQPKLVDPCGDKPVVPGGYVEFGSGEGAFMPITDGDSLTLQPTVQHLFIFVVSARTYDLHLGTGDLQGTVTFSAADQNGQTISLDTGCHVRDFTPADGGYLDLAEPFGLLIDPAVLSQIDGTTVTIDALIRDHDGRRATSTHSIVAHMP